MGVYITEQVRVFLLAVLLGFALGGLYDMVGAVRLRWPRVTPLLDVGYGLCLLGAAFLFVLRQGQGQLRLFVLLGMTGGGVLFFTGLSLWLRPVWAFWVDCLVCLGQICLLPVVISGNLLKSFQNYLKKLFYFWHKYSTIYYDMVERRRKGGIDRGTKKEKRTQEGKS